MRYALVEDKTREVVNVVMWEGKEWLPPRGHLVVPDEKVEAHIGGTWDEASNTFAAPRDKA